MGYRLRYQYYDVSKYLAVDNPQCHNGVREEGRTRGRIGPDLAARVDMRWLRSQGIDPDELA